MKTIQIINVVLQKLTNRRNKDIKPKSTKAKNVSRQRRTPKNVIPSIDGRCGICGGKIVEVNTITHRRACFKCGQEAK